MRDARAHSGPSAWYNDEHARWLMGDTVHRSYAHGHINMHMHLRLMIVMLQSERNHN